MAQPAPPAIFSPDRRGASRRRIAGLQAKPGAARYLIEDMVEDVLDRLAFLRLRPGNAIVSGDWTGKLAESLEQDGCAVTRTDPAGLGGLPVWDEETPCPAGPVNLAVSIGTLDTVNDLPGALIHLRNALAPGGLAIASFVAAGSLPQLRAAMLAADGDRPAARLHPMVDVRSGGQLLQRAGFSRQVSDGRALMVRYSSLNSLVADIRAQGIGNVLATRAPALTRAMAKRAARAFHDAADEDGRVTERFEVLTLSGWRD